MYVLNIYQDYFKETNAVDTVDKNLNHGKVKKGYFYLCALAIESLKVPHSHI